MDPIKLNLKNSKTTCKFPIIINKNTPAAPAIYGLEDLFELKETKFTPNPKIEEADKAAKDAKAKKKAAEKVAKDAKAKKEAAIKAAKAKKKAAEKAAKKAAKAKKKSLKAKKKSLKSKKKRR